MKRRSVNPRRTVGASRPERTTDWMARQTEQNGFLSRFRRRYTRASNPGKREPSVWRGLLRLRKSPFCAKL